MSDEDALDPLRGVKQRLTEAAQEIGLDLRQFAVVLSDRDDGPDHVQVVFTINSDIINGSAGVSEAGLHKADQAVIDERFSDIERTFRDQVREDRDREAVEDLLRQRRQNESGQ